MNVHSDELLFIICIDSRVASVPAERNPLWRSRIACHRNLSNKRTCLSSRFPRRVTTSTAAAIIVTRRRQRAGWLLVFFFFLETSTPMPTPLACLLIGTEVLQSLIAKFGESLLTLLLLATHIYIQTTLSCKIHPLSVCHILPPPSPLYVYVNTFCPSSMLICVCIQHRCHIFSACYVCVCPADEINTSGLCTRSAGYFQRSYSWFIDLFLIVCVRVC